MQTKVHLVVEIDFINTDGGYLGESASVDDHLAAAVAQARQIEFGKRTRNAMDGQWTPVKSKIRLDRIELIPNPKDQED